MLTFLIPKIKNVHSKTRSLNRLQTINYKVTRKHFQSILRRILLLDLNTIRNSSQYYFSEILKYLMKTNNLAYSLDPSDDKMTLHHQHLKSGALTDNGT